MAECQTRPDVQLVGEHYPQLQIMSEAKELGKRHTVCSESKIQPLVCTRSRPRPETASSCNTIAISTRVLRRMEINKVSSWVFSICKLAHASFPKYHSPEVNEPLRCWCGIRTHSIQLTIGLGRCTGLSPCNVNIVFYSNSESVERFICSYWIIQPRWQCNSEMWGSFGAGSV